MNRFIVYGLIDPRTGELRYIGKSTFGAKRIRRHWAASTLENPRNRCRTKAWCKSLLASGLAPEGVVLEVHAGAPEVAVAECDLIAYYRAIGCRLLNHTAGGEGRMGPRSAAERRGMSERMKGNQIAAGPKSAEHRRKLSEAAIGRNLSPEVRAKISVTLTGRKRGPLSVETRAKISAALMGHPKNPGSGRPRKVI